MISVISGTSERGLHMLSAIFFILALFAGYFVTDDKVPIAFYPFKFLSYQRWAFLAYIKNEFTDLNHCKTTKNSKGVITAIDLCNTVEESNADYEFWVSFVVLIGEAILIKIFVFFLLKYKYRRYVK